MFDSEFGRSVARIAEDKDKKEDEEVKSDHSL